MTMQPLPPHPGWLLALLAAKAAAEAAAKVRAARTEDTGASMSDLDVLQKASVEELDVLRDILAKKASFDDEAANGVRDLAISDENYASGYGFWLGQELRLMGGNTFANAGRGLRATLASSDAIVAAVGPEYHEVVCDVATKLKAPFNKAHPVERIERNILETVIEQVLAELSPEQREELAEQLGVSGEALSGPVTTAVLIIIWRTGGFASYKLTLIVVNWLAKALIGRGLSLAANAALVKWLAVFTGPAGWTITGLWAAIDLAGPAYKATIPSVVYIAMLRMGQAQGDQGGGGDDTQPDQGVLPAVTERQRTFVDATHLGDRRQRVRAGRRPA